MISITKDESYQVKPDFNISEFFSHSYGVTSHTFDERLIGLAQAVRTDYGKTVVNSTYRTTLHNSSVKGSPVSRHLFGHAIDLKIEDYDRFLSDLKNHQFNLSFIKEFQITEIAVYDTFVHFATSNKGQGVKPIINNMKKKVFFRL